MTGPTGSWLARLGGSLASTPAVGGIVVVGLVAGSLGAISAGALDGGPEGPSERLPLFACPDGASQVGEVQPGEQVLVTARSDDGAWLQVHFPDGVLDRAWAERAAFTLESDAETLPVAGCEAGTAPSFPVAGSTFTITANYSPSPPPTHRPTATPEVTASPTAAPTATAKATVKPTAAPTATPFVTAFPTLPPPPTVPPDTTGPTLTTPGSDLALIYAWCSPSTATISTTAADPSGVSTVTLFYRPPGSGFFSSKAMSRISGSAQDGTWRTTVTASTSWASSGDMPFYVVGVDALGNSATWPIPPFVAYPTIYVNTNIGDCIG